MGKQVGTRAAVLTVLLATVVSAGAAHAQSTGANGEQAGKREASGANDQQQGGDIDVTA